MSFEWASSTPGTAKPPLGIQTLERRGMERGSIVFTDLAGTLDDDSVIRLNGQVNTFTLVRIYILVVCLSFTRAALRRRVASRWLMKKAVDRYFCALTPSSLLKALSLSVIKMVKVVWCPETITSNPAVHGRKRLERLPKGTYLGKQRYLCFPPDGHCFLFLHFFSLYSVAGARRVLTRNSGSFAEQLAVVLEFKKSRGTSGSVV